MAENPLNSELQKHFVAFYDEANRHRDAPVTDDEVFSCMSLMTKITTRSPSQAFSRLLSDWDAITGKSSVPDWVSEIANQLVELIEQSHHNRFRFAMNFGLEEARMAIFDSAPHSLPIATVQLSSNGSASTTRSTSPMEESHSMSVDQSAGSGNG